MPPAEPEARPELESELVLIRHGETEWSREGRHTGRSDIPLTARGREEARRLGPRLRGRHLALVLTSPLSRARDTCRLSGFGDGAEETGDLLEWDYGGDEGRTTAEIRRERPGWLLWQDGPAGGETIAEVAARVDRVIARVREAGGDAIVFSHGHVLRVLTARWLGLDPGCGRLFALSPATYSVLGYEHDEPVVTVWNAEA